MAGEKPPCTGTVRAHPSRDAANFAHALSHTLSLSRARAHASLSRKAAIACHIAAVSAITSGSVEV